MMKGARTSKIPVQWAFWGKEPHGAGYKILDCSDGPLDRNAFSTIADRYPMGEQEDAHAVSAIRVGSGPRAYLGLSIQDSSDEVDWASRRFVKARYYVMSYEDLRQTPVSYEAMYQAFGDLTSHRGMFPSIFPALDPVEIGKNVTPLVARTSALLMTNEHVCVVGAQSASTEERLRFIDTVAALLPYSMRPQFTASTWTKSTTEHKFRLYFAGDSRDDGYTVDWTRGAQVPDDAGLARWYLNLIGRYESQWSTLIERLSRPAPAFSFEQPDLRAIMSIIDGRALASLSPPSATAPVVPPGPRHITHTLADLGEALRPRDHAGVEPHEVERLVYELDDLPVDEKDRSIYQDLVKRNDLLEPHPGIPSEVAYRLYAAVLRTAFPADLEPEHLPIIDRFSGLPRSAELDDALADRSSALCVVVTSAASGNLAKAVGRLSPARLVELAEGWPLSAASLDAVCRRLCACSPKELWEVLPGVDFLVAAMASSYRGDRLRQYTHLTALIQAARLGPVQGDAVFRAIFRSLPLWGVLQVAFTDFYREDSVARLSELTITDSIENAGLQSARVANAGKHLNGPVVPNTGDQRPWWRRWFPANGGSRKQDAGSPEEPSAVVERKPPPIKPPGPPSAFGPPRERRQQEFLGLIKVLLVILIAGLVGAVFLTVVIALVVR